MCLEVAAGEGRYRRLEREVDGDEGAHESEGAASLPGPSAKRQVPVRAQVPNSESDQHCYHAQRKWTELPLRERVVQREADDSHCLPSMAS